jgi:Right handed beta helix region
MRTRRLWQVVTFLAAAATMLMLAAGGSAKSLATFTVGNGTQLDAALGLVSPGDTIVLKPGTYFTADASIPPIGFQISVPNVTIRGNTSGSSCSATAKTIVDGDNPPATGPGHVGWVFTVTADNIQFKCFTMRYGTAGIVTDGFDGLNVQNMRFVGNGRDTSLGEPFGDAIWVRDGNDVRVNANTFSGMGFDGIESDVNFNSSNDGWKVKKNTFTNIHNSCIDMSHNTNAILGELVSGKPKNGNSCSVSGTAGVTDAIVVDDGGVAGPNQIYANTVTNAWLDCYFVRGNSAKFLLNTCVTSQHGMGASLIGDNITSDLFTTTLSSGGTHGNCVTAVGDNLKLTNTKCGATRDSGIVVNGLNAVVTNAEVRQAAASCFLSFGDNQVWTQATCGQVNGPFGLVATGDGSTFTNVSIGDAVSTCFEAAGPNQVWTTIKCHGSSNGAGIVVTFDNVTVDGFDFGSMYTGCAQAAAGAADVTFKNGHCARVLQGPGVIGFDDGLVINTVVVEAALGTCFAFLNAGNAIDGTLKNSTGASCGTGAASGEGIAWEGTGTNVISGNDIEKTASASLGVSALGGDYTITNNKFHDAQFASCVRIITPDTLTFTGNKAQMCYDGAFDIHVDLNPIVNSNIGNDASGLLGGATMYVECDSDCSGTQVNLNQLDGGGNERDGLFFFDNSGGTGATISGNKITNMQGTGLEVQGGSATLSNNAVLNSSDVDDLFGIFLNSDDNILTGSDVSGGYDNGIEVAGDNNVVASNNSHDNGEDGIHIAATADLTEVTSNQTKNNAGEGLEDDGTNTALTSNTSSGNRQDCAGTDATFVDGGGNACADGTFFTDPGVITAPVRRHHRTR